MQALRDVASKGFTHADLQEAAKVWQELGCATELAALHTHVEGAPLRMCWLSGGVRKLCFTRRLHVAPLPMICLSSSWRCLLTRRRS